MLDLTKVSQPAVLFFIGSGGSGKSTLAINFRDMMSREDLTAVRFDDAKKDFGISRWSDHLSEFPDRETCIREHVSKWIVSLLEANKERKLIICDINTDPDTLLSVMEAHPGTHFRIALVQPSDEVRCSRLANDESRKYMPKEELVRQLDSAFPDFLAGRSQELGLPRIFNEDRRKTVVEVASLATKLLREAV